MCLPLWLGKFSPLISLNSFSLPLLCSSASEIKCCPCLGLLIIGQFFILTVVIISILRCCSWMQLLISNSPFCIFSAVETFGVFCSVFFFNFFLLFLSCFAFASALNYPTLLFLVCFYKISVPLLYFLLFCPVFIFMLPLSSLPLFPPLGWLSPPEPTLDSPTSLYLLLTSIILARKCLGTQHLTYFRVFELWFSEASSCPFWLLHLF